MEEIISRTSTKTFIISSLEFLVKNKRIQVNAFVPIAIGMDNPRLNESVGQDIHLIWQMMAGIKPESVQRDFMKYTAQKIKQDLIKNHPAVLVHFKVDAKTGSTPPERTGRSFGKETL